MSVTPYRCKTERFRQRHRHFLLVILAFLTVYYLSLAFILFIAAPVMLAVAALMEKQVLSRYIPDEEDLFKEEEKQKLNRSRREAK